MNELNRDIKDANSKGKLSEQHYNLLNKKILDKYGFDFNRHWNETNEKIKLQLFNKNMKDYISIDNFYTKMEIYHSFLRQYKVHKEGTEDDLKNMNKEIFYTCEHFLLELDWTKYR